MLALVAGDLPEAERQVLIGTLTQAHADAVEAQLRAIGNQVNQVWLQAGRFQDPEDWVETYVNTVSTAQGLIYVETAAFLAEYVSLAQANPFEPALDITPKDWLVTPESPSAWSAGSSMSKALLAGTLWEVASRSAGRHAGQEAMRDLQWAMRGAGKDWRGRGFGPRLRWQKIASGAACGWCRLVAQQPYGSEDRIPSHSGDRCGIAPIVEGDGWESRLEPALPPEAVDVPAPPEAATMPPAPESFSAGQGDST